MMISTADIFDKYPNDVEVCETQFRQYGACVSFFGPCRTLQVPEDHLPVWETLREKGEGRILIVDGGGSMRVGIVGDVMAATAVQNGWAGLIIFAAIRDSAIINTLNLGVRALGTTARRSFIKAEARHDVAVTFGSAQFQTGHWVYVDLDSILVSKKRLDIEPPGQPNAAHQ